MVTDENLLELTRLHDESGVLSVYVDADPEHKATQRPPWAVSTKNELRDLEERVKAEGPRDRWALLTKRIKALEPTLAELLDSRKSGRGRALFAPLSSDDVTEVSIQLPLTNRVVLAEAAYIRPLIVAVNDGRPAGIAIISRSGVHILDWRLGVLEDVATFELDVDTDEWRRMKGPAMANPSRAQQSAPQRDRFERRLEEQRLKGLEEQARELDRLRVVHGWDRLAVAGDSRLTQPFSSELSGNDWEIVVDDRTLEGKPATEVAAMLLPELAGAARRRELGQLEVAISAALAGGTGALGLAETLDALAQGRAAHLFFNNERDYVGMRAPDGTLMPAEAIPPQADFAELATEPRLAERMIEQALATDALVTPLEGAGAAKLDEYDGVAALLRW